MIYSLPTACAGNLAFAERTRHAAIADRVHHLHTPLIVAAPTVKQTDKTSLSSQSMPFTFYESVLTDMDPTTKVCEVASVLVEHQRNKL